MSRPRQQKKTKTIDAWSFSRWQDHKTCPRKAKYKHVDKLPTEEGPALARGKETHEYMQDVANGKEVRLRRELKWAREKIEAVTKGREYSTERQVAFDSDWKPTSWFGKDAWGRVVMDLLVWSPSGRKTLLIDYKTGKIRSEHRDQLGLYALGVMLQHPEVMEVRAVLMYTDHEKTTEETFTRKQLANLKRKWRRAVTPMLSDTVFDPKPGTCHWCDFSKKKGGPCEAG